MKIERMSALRGSYFVYLRGYIGRENWGTWRWVAPGRELVGFYSQVCLGPSLKPKSRLARRDIEKHTRILAKLIAGPAFRKFKELEGCSPRRRRRRVQ